jgi:hypothetical protein
MFGRDHRAACGRAVTDQCRVGGERHDVHLRAPRGTDSVDAADAPDDLSGLEGDILTAETIRQGVRRRRRDRKFSGH